MSLFMNNRQKKKMHTCHQKYACALTLFTKMVVFYTFRLLFCEISRISNEFLFISCIPENLWITEIWSIMKCYWKLNQNHVMDMINKKKNKKRGCQTKIRVINQPINWLRFKWKISTLTHAKRDQIIFFGTITRKLFHYHWVIFCFYKFFPLHIWKWMDILIEEI